MELSDTLRTLVRRWYIVLLGLLMTAGMGWVVYRAVPTTYESTGSLLLMPSETMVEEAGNPYLYLGGMRDALDVLVRRSDAEQIRETTLSGFDGADYRVEPDATTQSPIIVVTAESPSPDDSLALLQVALGTVGSNLAAMQDELALPDARRIQMRQLVVDASATADTKTAYQAAMAAVGAGLLGTLLLTGFVDGLLMRRGARRSAPRKRRRDTDAPVVGDDPGPGTTPPTQEPAPAPAVAPPTATDELPNSRLSPVLIGGHVSDRRGETGLVAGRGLPLDR